MAAMFWFMEKISRLANVIAVAAVTFIMLLTVSDVVLRYFKHPIVGTFEMVGMAGAIAIGFGIPLNSWLRGLVQVDFLVNVLPTWGKNTVNIITRVVSIALFGCIGVTLIDFATALHKSGEVSLTRQIPFYPIAYGLGIVCFVECLVLVTDIFKIVEGRYE